MLKVLRRINELVRGWVRAVGQAKGVKEEEALAQMGGKVRLYHAQQSSIRNTPLS